MTVPGSAAAASAQDAEVAVFDPFTSGVTEREWWIAVADYEAREADAADRAVEGAEVKLAKYQALVDNVKVDLAEAKENARKARKRADDAVAMVEG